MRRVQLAILQPAGVAVKQEQGGSPNIGGYANFAAKKKEEEEGDRYN